MKHLTIASLLTLLVLGGCALDNQLARASSSDYYKVKELIEKGIDVNKAVNGSFPLFRALEANKTDTAILLLKNGANPNQPDLNHGDYPMSWAVINNSEAQVKSLLENGADPNGVLLNKDSYLIHASLKNNTEIVRLLLSAGANPNVVNSNGVGPLAVSVRHDNYELTSLLLESGARKDLGNFWNEVIHYNSSTYFIVSVFLDLDLIGETILIGNKNEKGFVGKGILINPTELFRYEGYLEESMANGRGKLITKRFVYEGVFEKGEFVSGMESLKVKTLESNKNISSNKGVNTENLSVKNKSRGKEIAKQILAGSAELTKNIFVGLMKFSGPVLIGIAKEMPRAYAEQKRLNAHTRAAYLRGRNDGRRICSGKQC